MYDPYNSHHKFKIYLKGTSTYFGSSCEALDPQSVLRWLVQIEGLVSKSQANKWCKKKNPVLYVFDIDKNQELVYSYNHGEEGVQLMLFDLKKTTKESSE